MPDPAKRPTRGSPEWQQIEKIYAKHFYRPDMQAVRAVYAGFAAHQLTGQPVWPMLVGPPGSLKTVLLQSLRGQPDTYIIDKITDKTLISGYVPSTPGPSADCGLLSRVGSSFRLIIPDFSTILSISRENRVSVLSDFRRLYDGHIRKEFGSGSSVTSREWNGRATLITAGTSDVDRHYSVFASLGERFVLIRWPRAGIEAARKAIYQDMTVIEADLCRVVGPLFMGLKEQIGRASCRER